VSTDLPHPGLICTHFGFDFVWQVKGGILVGIIVITVIVWVVDKSGQS
jgi:hypothetical protein